MNKPIDPYHIIKLLSEPNFFDLIVEEEFKFLNHSNPKGGNWKHAFEIVNEHYFECTSNYKFSSYESWKVSKSQKRKRAKIKKHLLDKHSY